MEKARIDYKELRFGLALGHAAMDPASVPDFLTPGMFDAIELPTDCFLHRDADFQRRLACCKFRTVRAGHLMAPDLTRDIPFLAENYRRDYVEQASIMVRTLAAAGASGAFLGFDMRRILGDEAAENAALEIVRRMVPVLYRENFELLVPYRIPFKSERDIAATPLMGRFLRGTLSPLVKLSLDIHPFEVKPEEDKTEMLGMLGCEAHQAVLVYDADSGLHISPMQFRPWAELLERRLFRGPYLLCPRSIRNRMAIPETDLFAKMVSDLRNE
jgi:hypothetical protein